MISGTLLQWLCGIRAQETLLAAGISEIGGVKLMEKSGSLVRALKAAFLLQSSAIVLECVEPAATHPYVQSTLKAFCAVTKYFCAQTILPLHKVLANRRTRWWAVLSNPSIGPLHITACSFQRLLTQE